MRDIQVDQEGKVNVRDDAKMMRMVMIGAFGAAAVLFFMGKRPAAMALAGVGLASLASEHPEGFQKVWNNAPEYLEKGTRIVQNAGGFIEKFAEQATRMQQVRKPGATGADYVT